MSPWSAKGKVLIDASVKSGALDNTKSQFTVFASRCKGQINSYQINTTPPANTKDLKT